MVLLLSSGEGVRVTMQRRRNETFHKKANRIMTHQRETLRTWRISEATQLINETFHYLKKCLLLNEGFYFRQLLRTVLGHCKYVKTL